MSVVVRPDPGSITVERFLADPHGAEYRDVVDRDAVTFDRVVEILNEHQVVHDMTSATRLDLPALQGAVEPLEADASIVEVLGGPHGQRFRQAVGVAVRLKMESLGYATTGRKSSVRARSGFSDRAEVLSPLGRRLRPWRRGRRG